MRAGDEKKEENREAGKRAGARVPPCLPTYLRYGWKRPERGAALPLAAAQRVRAKREGKKRRVLLELREGEKAKDFLFLKGGSGVSEQKSGRAVGQRGVRDPARLPARTA